MLPDNCSSTGVVADCIVKMIVTFRLPATDLTVQFERLLDRILDGLVQPLSATPGPALLGDGEGFGDAIRLRR